MAESTNGKLDFSLRGNSAGRVPFPMTTSVRMQNMTHHGVLYARIILRERGRESALSLNVINTEAKKASN